MHIASRVKFEAFVETYLNRDDIVANAKSILDVGSRSVQDTSAYNYRHSTDPVGLAYTGIDFEEGPNVDVVPKNPYVWEEFKNESFDYVVSGQAFEHNPFPWVTFCEIARVLKVGGVAFIIAPSAGPVHRWPYDCWRYYPDSWAGLCRLAGIEATEIIREEDATAGRVPGGGWMDSVVIATKQPFADAAAKKAFHKNLTQFVAPFKTSRFDVVPATINAGPAFRAYMQKAKQFKAPAGAPAPSETPAAGNGDPPVDPRFMRRKRAWRLQRAKAAGRA